MYVCKYETFCPLVIKTVCTGASALDLSNLFSKIRKPFFSCAYFLELFTMGYLQYSLEKAILGHFIVSLLILNVFLLIVPLGALRNSWPM